MNDTEALINCIGTMYNSLASVQLMLSTKKTVSVKRVKDLLDISKDTALETLRAVGAPLPELAQTESKQ